MKLSPVLFTIILTFWAGSAAAQTATHATRNCLLRGGPSLGIGTYHCQGGECVIEGVYARIVPPGSTTPGGSGGSASRTSWQFTVEPSLWEIYENGPAAGRLQAGDVLVAVNDSPITTQEAATYLERMEAGAVLALTVRRADRLVRVEVTPIASCQPFTVSAGVADRPSFLIPDEFGRLPR